MRITFREIEAEVYRVIAECTDTETGALSDEGIAMLEALEMEKSKKQENIALLCLALDSDIAQIDAEMERLTALKGGKKKRRDGLGEYLKYSLGGEKLETALVKVSFKKTSAVNLSKSFVKDYLETHKELFREKTDYTPNKEAIRAYLEAGNELDGAQIVQNVSMSIK